MCRGCLRCVSWFSYWFDNLGFISEGNTYRCCAASSLPLWGNTDVASSDIERNFWRRCRGGSSTYTRFLITNLISSQFTLFAIFLSFSSRFPLPHFAKICHFYLPLLFVCRFPVRSLVCLCSCLPCRFVSRKYQKYVSLCCHVPSICLHLCLLKIY